MSFYKRKGILKRNFRIIGFLICLVLIMLISASCSAQEQGLQDGYFTAEMSEYDAYGWKEYLIICVSDGKIVNVEYNAKNLSGLIKSWDMDYMRTMNETDGTYPNEYARQYSDSLLARQDPDKVDAVTGATQSHKTFQLLAKAAIGQSKTGDKDIAYVDVVYD